MEEQFILRVPPEVADRIDKLLSATGSSSADVPLDISFSEDGRNGTFLIGNDSFPANLLDLPGIVESYKTYDDNVLIKSADVGQMILVRNKDDPPPEGPEYKHGITPPMKDARRRRFRREPDLNPEVVQRVEKDLLNILDGRAMAKPAPKSVVPRIEAASKANTGEADGSDSDDSEYISI